jgi:hypothetical protein
MLETLITSKTRIKLLLKFFLNTSSCSYLRALECEFGDSSNAIRLELNRLENASLLSSELISNRKYFRANVRHPLFADIHNIVLKYVGLDQVIKKVSEKLGDLDKVYLLGDFARGIDGKIIDLLFSGTGIDEYYLIRLINKAEKIIHRKIRYLVFSPEECDDYIKDLRATELLLLWEV